MTHCLLHAKGILTKIWEKVVYCSNYLLNCVLSQEILNITRIRKWSGRKPFFHHLRMFECIAWAHIQDHCRKKLDAKSHAYITMS